MTLPRQTLITTGELAIELGKTKSTISRWSHNCLKPALFKRGYFRVAILREMGVLPKQEVAQ